MKLLYTRKPGFEIAPFSFSKLPVDWDSQLDGKKLLFAGNTPTGLEYSLGLYWVDNLPIFPFVDWRPG